MDPQAHHQLHFILFPLMAQGHMIPMIDIARLLAQRGVIVTIVTTPLNALRFNSIIDRAIQSGLPIRVLQLRFPHEEAGLPEGCENIDTLPSPELGKNFFTATYMLQRPFEQSLQELQPLPTCMISDMCLPWTSETALKFQIPRIVFHGTSTFYLLCIHNILHYNVLETVTSETEPFVVPGLHDRIEITAALLPGNLYQPSGPLGEVWKQVRDAELTTYGVVVNSFYDLEPTFADEYKKAKQNKVWHVGPVSLCNKEAIDKVERGNKASIDEKKCLKWLDSREPNSVVYVCLGSICRLIPSQLMEIGLGLEASKRPFVWVIRCLDPNSVLDKWLCEEGFEERTKDRSLIIRGWAPQVVILSHWAVGGFLTHCGWNSTLEGVCASVPMITWPMLAADQFLNEKLIVQILGIGVRVGVKVAVGWGEEEKAGVLVKKEEVEKAVHKLMDGGEEGEERRKRARELGEKTGKAMEEGGSSYLNMTLLIQDIMHQANKKLGIHT